jgi:hypothetical protein
MTRRRAPARQVGEDTDESEWGDLVGLRGEVMELVWSGSTLDRLPSRRLLESGLFVPRTLS